jgi:hypothetical protein
MGEGNFQRRDVDGGQSRVNDHDEQGHPQQGRVRALVSDEHEGVGQGSYQETDSENTTQKLFLFDLGQVEQA